MSSSEDTASRVRELPLTIEAEAPRARERRWPDYLLLTFIAIVCSLTAFLYYWHTGELLLYGDAVAHLNIGRRVLDSRLPGLFQFGTVWLPLPHLLMQPFIWSTWMWKTGLAGSIPSMFAFVAGVVGIFRLVRHGMASIPNNEHASRVSAWFAAMVCALNPNLLYLQATAMTESIYLAAFVWATVFLSEFRLHLLQGNDPQAQRSLVGTGFFLLLGIMTRYDGWFTAVVYAIVALLLLISASRQSGLEPLHFIHERSWRRALIAFIILLAIFPIGWFWFNKKEFKDPLAFVRGPYSARGIEARTRQAGQPHHPGWNAPSVGATYFVKSAKLNMATTERSERIWIYAAVLGSVFVLGFIRPLSAWLLLWIPVPFYAISIAWGGVPIFMPVWWPFSYYNVRYGTQLLPAFAAFGAVLLFLFLRRFRSRKIKLAFIVAGFLFVLTSYVNVWRAVPICLQEARVNSRDRIVLEKQLSAYLPTLPTDSTILMFIGQHGGALQSIGFPLKRTINECQKRIWGSALFSPARMADFVIATDGDPVSNAIKANPEGLQKIAEFTAPRQSSISVYRSSLHQ
ncbi:MAG TPA: hypothetical protein VN577_06895 [Terriglobales bacterium]|nr:hypothetical protein [Terriglobales bacterium]